MEYVGDKYNYSYEQLYIYRDFDVFYTIFVTKDEKSLIQSNLTQQFGVYNQLNLVIIL